MAAGISENCGGGGGGGGGGGLAGHVFFKTLPFELVSLCSERGLSDLGFKLVAGESLNDVGEHELEPLTLLSPL